MATASTQPREVRIETPWGWLSILHQDRRLLSVELDSPTCESNERDWNEDDRQVARQFQRYLAFASRPISLPRNLAGTPFQQRVWRELIAIPAGEIRTYGQLARHLETGARAVANACRANPLPIVVPCHRVVAANGSGGFMGAASGRPVQIKQWLLQHERIG